MCFCRLCVSLCVCFSKSFTSVSFFQLYYLNSHVMKRVCTVRCPLGIRWYMRDWPQKICVWKRGWAIEGGREGSQLSVRYIIIWPCGFYRVVTWRTSLTDGIHFLYFTFPWTPCFTQCFAPTFSGSPLPSSSAPGAIRGGGVWSAKMLTFVYHFGLWMEPISRSNGTRASKTKLQGLVVLLAKGVLQIAIDWHVADLFDFVNQMKKNI